ncbi:hypothetical protein MXZ80_08275 [Streptococcus uberis]|nr:hypothetical protein [Streptococcus uberis]MCK1208048.1 hypothetical protein [Streptococcus uberis]MCK1243431.1 hypothetical protein [Streptococcus uberis]
MVLNNSILLQMRDKIANSFTGTEIASFLSEYLVTHSVHESFPNQGKFESKPHFVKRVINQLLDDDQVRPIHCFVNHSQSLKKKTIWSKLF